MMVCLTEAQIATLAEVFSALDHYDHLQADERELRDYLAAFSDTPTTDDTQLDLPGVRDPNGDGIYA